jgi:hypothetical protein
MPCVHVRRRGGTVSPTRRLIAWYVVRLRSLFCARACSGGGTSTPKEPPAEGPLPEGLSTIQQLLYTLAQGQLSSHARMLELAEASPGHLLKALEALKEQYKADVKGVNDKYMESKRRWRYSLSQAVAHRHLPEEATRFEAEAAMWRRQWEGASPELVEAARKVKLDNTPKVGKPGRACVWVGRLTRACGATVREEAISADARSLALSCSCGAHRSRRSSPRTCRRS